MKVLQLIDSLEAGGSERVAVNYANALVDHINGSFLCSTRKEGLLKQTISKHVVHIFLNRKSTFDFKAILVLHTFIKRNEISIIHAHASSFFLATTMKLLIPKIVLIWHDHFGNSEFLDKRPTWVLKWCSLFFNHVLCVNATLETWAKENLDTNSVRYMPNYAVLKNSKGHTKLQGIEGKRIVCLANLRPQKDHLNLLKAFTGILKQHPDWTLHLVGQDFNDGYACEIKDYIKGHALSGHVFSYGSCSDTMHILKQSTIGVLASKSEGLPLSLLEYGLAQLPVVSTRVGDCHKVISNKDEGVLVASENDKDLAEGLLILINDVDLREKMAKNLRAKVSSVFSESSTIQ